MKIIKVVVFSVLIVSCQKVVTNKKTVEIKDEVNSNNTANDNEWSFAVMGDSRGGQISIAPDGSGGINENAITRACEHILTVAKPGIVIFTGDTIQGSTVPENNVKQYESLKKTIRPFEEKGFKFLFTSGNHEVSSSVNDFRPDLRGKPLPATTENHRIMMEAFSSLPRNAPESEGLSYHVEYKNALFVIADSFRPGYFNEVNSKWLENTINSIKEKSSPDHIFAASHSPAFPCGGHVLNSLSNCNVDVERMQPAIWPWNRIKREDGSYYRVDWRHKRDLMWKVLSESGTTAYFAGHEHNLTRMKVGGVWHIVSGGLTEALYRVNDIPLLMYDGNTHTPRAGDTFWGKKSKGYFLITINGKKASARVFGWENNDAPIELLNSFEM